MAFAFYTLLKHDSFSNILTHSLFKILTLWERYMKEKVLSNDNKKEEE